jgi:hypothetical protein
MLTMCGMLLDTARPRAGAILAATALRRRIAGGGCALTMRYPQVPGRDAGLGRRALRGFSSLLALNALYDGLTAADARHNPAPDRLQPATSLGPAVAPASARGTVGGYGL